MSGIVRGRAAALRVDLSADGAGTLTLHPERTLHDTHWGYHFAACRHFPVTLAYPAAEGLPLVSVFLDATAGLPAAPRVRRGDRIAVALPDGSAVEWARNADGWQWVC